jgi:hypothetical protein
MEQASQQSVSKPQNASPIQQQSQSPKQQAAPMTTTIEVKKDCPDCS